jgi:hypothetical protein
MKRIEPILILLFFLAIIMNLNLIVFGEILTIISLMSLAIFYFYFSSVIFSGLEFKDVKNKIALSTISPRRKLLSFGTGICLGLTVMGCLFYLMRWPGTSLNLGSGLFGLLVISILSYLKFLKFQAEFHKKLLIRTVPLLIFGALLFISPKTAWLDTKYRDYPNYVKAIDKLEKDPNNKELQENLRIEREKIYFIK